VALLVEDEPEVKEEEGACDVVGFVSIVCCSSSSSSHKSIETTEEEADDGPDVVV
jgi:hypothetical protein